MEAKLLELIAVAAKLPIDEIDQDMDIFESNMISSLGLLELVAQMEKEFQIVILPEELIHENFNTVNAIRKFISSKIK